MTGEIEFETNVNKERSIFVGSIKREMIKKIIEEAVKWREGKWERNIKMGGETKYGKNVKRMEIGNLRKYIKKPRISEQKTIREK